MFTPVYFNTKILIVSGFLLVSKKIKRKQNQPKPERQLNNLADPSLFA